MSNEFSVAVTDFKREVTSITPRADPPDIGGAVSLPLLEIRSDDPTATARELAGLIAERTDFLFNGYGVVQVVVESDGMPQAIEVSNEAVRVLGHKICQPVRRTPKGTIKPTAIKADIASII